MLFHFRFYQKRTGVSGGGEKILKLRVTTRRSRQKKSNVSLTFGRMVERPGGWVAPSKALEEKHVIGRDFWYN